MNPTNKDQAKAQLDKTLQGNDKIETAIAALQQDAMLLLMLLISGCT